MAKANVPAVTDLPTPTLVFDMLPVPVTVKISLPTPVVTTKSVPLTTVVPSKILDPEIFTCQSLHQMFHSLTNSLKPILFRL